jgi:GTP cyclohydrolase II
MLPLRFADGFGTTARIYTFDGLADGREHLALGLAGGGVSADPEVPPPARIHSECFTGDVLRSERCDCRPQLLEVVRRIAQVGALPLYLRQEDRGISLYTNLDAYGLQDAGLDTYDANLALGYSEDGRDSRSRRRCWVPF